VSRVAVALGGGGHRLAAGFTGHGRPEDVAEVVRAQLDSHLIAPLG
jgi:phosphoesterase RecJ-like protein